MDDLGPDYVELAWGTADGVNTIGRSAPSRGEATIHIAGRTLATRANQITVADLAPDHDYAYTVSLGQQTVGQGEVRTWAAKSQRLVFFVIGDFGTGQAPQYKIARAMWDEFQRRAKTDNPVRFILSIGDNIYGNIAGFFFGVLHTGADDSDWADKFFEPYRAADRARSLLPDARQSRRQRNRKARRSAGHSGQLPLPARQARSLLQIQLRRSG